MAAPGTQSSENCRRLVVTPFSNHGRGRAGSGPSQVCSSNMLIAFCKLRLIRLNEADNEPISSLLL